MFVVSLSPANRTRVTENAADERQGPIATLLQRLATASVPLDELEEEIVGVDESIEHSAAFWYAMQQLARQGTIAIDIVSAHRCVARVMGILPTLTPPLPTDSLLRLSRFTTLRPSEACFLVESPHSAGIMTLFSPEAFVLFHKLARGIPFENLIAESKEMLEPDVIVDLVQSLAAMGVFGQGSEPGDGALEQWEHHDALMHAHSRGGRQLTFPAGTYRFRGVRPPEPALKPRSSLSSIYLPDVDEPPDIAVLRRLTTTRRSIRRYGAKPIRSAEIGTFLRLTGRIYRVEPMDVARGKLYETEKRGYPGGGGCHELEIYLVVHRCDGLAPGVYWYDGYHDKLSLLKPPHQASDRLLSGAAQSMGQAYPNVPDVLICIGARFGRVNWKYEGLAYAVILKDAGVLLELMDLTATALGLGACIVGRGHALDFLEATGNQAFEEESVGEFALGSLPEDDAHG